MPVKNRGATVGLAGEKVEIAIPIIIEPATCRQEPAKRQRHSGKREVAVIPENTV